MDGVGSGTVIAEEEGAALGRGEVNANGERGNFYADVGRDSGLDGTDRSSPPEVDCVDAAAAEGMHRRADDDEIADEPSEEEDNPPKKKKKGWQGGSTPRQRAQLQKHLDAQWDGTFDHLKAYHQDHGHTDVPAPLRRRKRRKKTGASGEGNGSAGESNSEEEEGEYDHLYKFCERNRQQYRLYATNRKSSLTPDRIAKLRSIDFSFDPTGDKWRAAYERLKQYKHEHGHCNPILKRGDPADLRSLAAWARNQRVVYASLAAGRNRDHALTLRPKIQLLRELGFEFHAPNMAETTWEDNLSKLRRLTAERAGGVDSEETFLRGQEKVAFLDWMNKQRLAYRVAVAGKTGGALRGMTLERLAKLIDAGMDFKPVETRRREAKARAEVEARVEAAEAKLRAAMRDEVEATTAAALSQTENPSLSDELRLEGSPTNEEEAESTKRSPRKREFSDRDAADDDSNEFDGDNSTTTSKGVTVATKVASVKRTTVTVKNGKAATAKPKVPQAAAASKRKAAPNKARAFEKAGASGETPSRKRGRPRKLPTRPKPPEGKGKSDKTTLASHAEQRSAGDTAVAAEAADVTAGAVMATATATTVMARGRKCGRPKKNPPARSPPAARDITSSDIHENDVLCGRASRLRAHPGNRLWISQILLSGRLFATASTSRRRELVQNTLDAIYGQDPPGRFLRKRYEGALLGAPSEVWVDIGGEGAEGKTLDAIRAKSKVLARSNRTLDPNGHGCAAGDDDNNDYSSSHDSDVQVQERVLRNTEEVAVASILANEVGQSSTR